ncbi:MAG: beta-ketoacyl synthase [Deltaproteobacteria bacterium CG_4_9_14_3_um_filter_65_9]|nr:MAG: beta-ketoacyl synthase [Deltaproteobacteria bacterium CG_4_9_14_3_um_filter_65_9]
MNEIRITEAASVTGLGPDLETTWRRLLAGETAIRPIRRFDAGRYSARNASWVEGLESGGNRSLLYPLLERLLVGFGPLPTGCRLVTATTKGCIDTFERVRKGLPGAVDDIPVSGPLTWLASRLGLNGPGVNINSACASSSMAVARAAAMIASGRADAVLVVCMDLVSEFVFSGFHALQALDPAGCRPFDRNRNGLSLGEGGAALLMMSAETARRKGIRGIGSVVGWGASNDATHVTAPARDGCGLIQAVRRAMAKASIGTDDIAAINAHGTGTVYNDEMEVTAFETVFGSRRIPMNSIKGAIGHTLGAAGGIEVAVGLRSLVERTLPPTTGFHEPMEKCVYPVSPFPQTIDGNYLLSTNSGFGGINAALILKGNAE